jgi:hypothetical protein
MIVYWLRRRNGKYRYDVGDLECTALSNFMYFGKDSHGNTISKWRGELYFTKIDVLRAIYEKGKYPKGMYQEIKASMKKFPQYWI